MESSNGERSLCLTRPRNAAEESGSSEAPETMMLLTTATFVPSEGSKEKRLAPSDGALTTTTYAALR
jgi:hypothetical protein